MPRRRILRSPSLPLSALFRLLTAQAWKFTTVASRLPQTNCSLVAAPARWRLSALQTEISRVWSRSATGGFGVGSTDERDTSCATRLGCRCLGWRHVLRLYGAASLGRTP